MADGTKIEWADSTWQIVTGCSVVSPGCTNCYAMRLAGTRLQHHPSRAGLTRDTKVGPVWTGEVRFNEDWLDQPLRWRKPRRIFVCAHGDLFYERVPYEWIDRVFAVMALCPQHVFIVLTKRAARMRDYMTTSAIAGCDRNDDVAGAAFDLRERTLQRGEYRFTDTQCFVQPERWPLPNVVLMVSAEDQPRAYERIPHLLATPAAVRGVSLEPLLGPIFLYDEWLRADLSEFSYGSTPLDWVIVGGESGPRARPMHPAWARDLRDQCQANGVPFFFKQWGQFKPGISGRSLAPDGSSPGPDKWNDASTAWMMPVGKAAAGRLLDGREWSEMPEVRR